MAGVEPASKISLIVVVYKLSQFLSPTDKDRWLIDIAYHPVAINGLIFPTYLLFLLKLDRWL